MKWYTYIICFVLIFCGIFSAVNLFNIWSHSSNVIGTPTTIETKNDYKLICKFDNNLSFESEDNETYISQTNYGFFEFNGKNGDYALLLNDNIISDVEISSGKIIGQTKINFYSTDGEIVCFSIININIVFYSDKTQITITTINENNSYAYLTKYITNNGLILKVVERGLV